MNLSVISLPGINYPEPDQYFSPDELFPEYPFKHLSSQPNPVYRAVRSCLSQLNLDVEHFGKPAWNPFGEWIRPGSNVFVLCNFVYHRRESESREDFFAKCTHGSVIRTILDYILIATGKNSTVHFGNAPVQSCNWEKILVDTGANRVEEFYKKYSPHVVTAKDLRVHKIRKNSIGGLREVMQKGSDNEEVAIDLGQDSLLEELYARHVLPHFRLCDYNPRETEEHHRHGRHIYRIHRRILEADVLFSIPKLKTHEKVLVTMGIKGCVGAVSHKVCLAHHRKGPPSRGGDEYVDGYRPLNRLESRISDHQNWQRPSMQTNWRHIFTTVLRKLIRLLGGTTAGSWSGNDTAWRMALDIARILSHATITGTLLEESRRKHLVLIDGIIAGEGQGPLSPSPRQAGFLLFSDDVVAGDIAATRFMGFAPEIIPILQGAIGLSRYPLTTLKSSEIPAILNGAPILDVAILGQGFTPFRKPVGW